MSESEKEQSHPRAPAQQAQQPQPFTPENQDGVQTTKLDSRQLDGGEGAVLTDVTEVQASTYDEARFTADVIMLYEAVLSEPIPDEMLRLVKKLGNEEPK